MGRKLQDLTGSVFGRLTVREYLGRKIHSSVWRCVCECGVEKEVMASALKTGNTKSCGCYQSERMASLMKTHGHASHVKPPHPSYKIWDGIKQRCLNPKSKGFEHYGGRGIKICDRWRDNFEYFILDMGPRPTGWQIERDDVNGDYEPRNCRWIPGERQARNRRNNRIVAFHGEKISLVEAAERAGIPYKTVKGRIQKGWSVDRALSCPVDEVRRTRSMKLLSA